ncbi:MBL fold metallo-hydrolase RNA specificity domain-containing protein [Ekhidna sp. To15]|uniref:MBL fold metallo-hydrolase RNA specificity domain-containing protein n=1 Tax=Ekhidna sp. To15 TaxID=3395267 RepID=UPI003F527BD7
MNIRVKFLGGAGSVTGSKFLLTIEDFSLLVDCGLFQGLKELRIRNWDELPIDPASIDAVLLTHAHIDHSGYLPLLYKNGFGGKVHCTEPTLELAEILLSDSAKLQEEEAEFANKKGYSRHQPAKPLYKVQDALDVLNAFEAHPFDKTFRIHDLVEVRFFHAGHILGAASIEIKVYTSQGIKSLVFSGDLGPEHSPLHVAPAKPPQADILFMESTYGGRDHKDQNLENELRRLLIQSDESRGCILIPAFSLGRTQLVLYYLWKIFQNMRSRPIYVDSPMAISVTRLYKRFTNYHRLESDSAFGHHIFDAPFVHYVTEQSKSKTLNTIKDRAIIISASGMATGGRILHHLYHRLPNAQDTILFTGFLPDGTRGKDIVDGSPMVKIFGEEVSVKAKVHVLDGLSAHADQDELVAWSGHIHAPPKMTFLIHGEKEQSTLLKERIAGRGWNVTIPDYLDTFTLFDHI